VARIAPQSKAGSVQVQEINMAIEFKTILINRPGRLAHFTSVLGEAGVRIQAIHQMSDQSGSIVQFVPDDPAITESVLNAASISFTSREVLIVDVLDQPATLGDVATVMADAGVNIDSIYLMTSGVVVLGVDDLDGAKQVAAGMAVKVN
jgi:hypothetical protein